MLPQRVARRAGPLPIPARGAVLPVRLESQNARVAALFAAKGSTRAVTWHFRPRRLTNTSGPCMPIVVPVGVCRSIPEGGKRVGGYAWFLCTGNGTTATKLTPQKTSMQSASAAGERCERKGATS